MGQYTVVAYNGAGEVRSSCTLSKSPEAAFKVPRFNRQLMDQYLISGQRAIIEVIAEGNPPPEFKWRAPVYKEILELAIG